MSIRWSEPIASPIGALLPACPHLIVGGPILALSSLVVKASCATIVVPQSLLIDAPIKVKWVDIVHCIPDGVSSLDRPTTPIVNAVKAVLRPASNDTSSYWWTRLPSACIDAYDASCQGTQRQASIDASSCRWTQHPSASVTQPSCWWPQHEASINKPSCRWIPRTVSIAATVLPPSLNQQFITLFHASVDTPACRWTRRRASLAILLCRWNQHHSHHRSTGWGASYRVGAVPPSSLLLRSPSAGQHLCKSPSVGRPCHHPCFQWVGYHYDMHGSPFIPFQNAASMLESGWDQIVAAVSLICNNKCRHHRSSSNLGWNYRNTDNNCHRRSISSHQKHDNNCRRIRSNSHGGNNNHNNRRNSSSHDDCCSSITDHSCFKHRINVKQTVVDDRAHSRDGVERKGPNCRYSHAVSEHWYQMPPPFLTVSNDVHGQIDVYSSNQDKHIIPVQLPNQHRRVCIIFSFPLPLCCCSAHPNERTPPDSFALDPAEHLLSHHGYCLDYQYSLRPAPLETLTEDGVSLEQSLSSLSASDFIATSSPKEIHKLDQRMHQCDALLRVHAIPCNQEQGNITSSTWYMALACVSTLVWGLTPDAFLIQAHHLSSMELYPHFAKTAETDDSSSGSALPETLFTLAFSRVTPFCRSKGGVPDTRCHVGNDASLFSVVISPQCLQSRALVNLLLVLHSKLDLGTFTICLILGCSRAITFYLDNLESPPVFGDFGSIQTVDGATRIEGFGSVHWIFDDQGISRTTHVPA